MLRSMVRSFLRLLGKFDHRVIVIFASSESAWRDAVQYVRDEAPDFPIWLIAAAPVDRETAALCDHIIELPNGPRLPLRAAKVVWRRWVVLNVLTLTREPGYAWLKVAPLLVPPWRLLVMNEHGDFLNAWPFGLLGHGLRRLRDRIATTAVSGKDFAFGIFWKIAWTMLDLVFAFTSRPWERLGAAPPPAPGPAVSRRPDLKLWTGKSLPAEMSLGDLEALFDRPDTFAASYQYGRAGFQRDILPRAAFRRLAPGEATAVVAPVSEVVMLDAAKLAQLGGIPSGRGRGWRWLLLYWKAAAAGWKSYSVGLAVDRLPMVADRARREAGFCFHLLRHQTQTRSDNAARDGLRGSICFHPRLRGPAPAGARRVLIVSPYLPFPLSHGGAVRIFNLARELSQRWELILIAFREEHDRVDYARLATVFSRVIVVDHDERRRPDPAVPEAAAQARSRAMTAAIRQAAAEYHPDLLQVEYTHMAGYREALPEMRAVLVEHDVTFSLHQQLVRSARAGGEQRRARAEYDRWHRFESHWLGRYDAVAVMSEEEKQQAVSAGAPADATWVVPNGVDTGRFRPSEEPPPDPPEILFVGSFRHLPNVLGYQFLIREILPRLWSRFPELRLRVIAGPEYEKHWQAFAGRRWDAERRDARIGVEGFVEDLAPRYQRAWLVAVPLEVSAGTNIKVLEALACGKPIVSTSPGCAGLDLAGGEELLLADDPAAFAEAARRLLEDAALRGRLGERARRAAVERFGWEQAAARAAEMYEALLAGRPPSPIPHPPSPIR